MDQTHTQVCRLKKSNSKIYTYSVRANKRNSLYIVMIADSIHSILACKDASILKTKNMKAIVQNLYKLNCGTVLR